MGKPDILEMRDHCDVKGLIKALKHKDKWVRFGAADALGHIGDDRAVEPLAEALKDEDGDVHKAAATAFEKIRGTKELRRRLGVKEIPWV
jgi:HEAT repeat protein